MIRYAIILMLVTGCAEPCPFETNASINLAAYLCSWSDHPDNPLVEPPAGQFLIGDPSVIPPGHAPDGKWHMFANSLFGIHHHLSSDGVKWERKGAALFGAMAFRAFVFKEGATFNMFFEKIVAGDSSILLSTSADLYSWSKPEEVLRPSLKWEKEGTSTVSNPFVIKRGNHYWLYYSAGGVWLATPAGVFEPKYIGLARSTKLAGPYTKQYYPLIKPDPKDPLRTKGAGSIKLLDRPLGGRLVALNNGIYTDSQGRGRSAIMVLKSSDGLKWEKVCPGNGAVLSPTGSGWKKALIYGFDTEFVGQELWAFYNARDGWSPATERIGLSKCDLGCEPLD